MASGISFSLGANKPSAFKASPHQKPKPTNGTKRPHAALHDDSDDEDTNIKEDVTHFDQRAGGAIDVRRPKVEKKPLVIQPQANRDWKEASGQNNKRQKYGVPDKTQRAGGTEDKGREKEVLAKKQGQGYGLNVMKVEKVDVQAEGSGASSEDAAQGEVEGAPKSEEAPARPKTTDEKALDALMGIKQDSTLVLPAASEHEVFERDYKTAPDMATLEEYAAVPVEEFGAALLRGMGWKEGQGIGNQRGKKLEKVKVAERRPALLGIGAKADAAVAAELGAWGQSAKGRKRVDTVYNPLTLRNKNTGEELTEEELKLRLAAQKEQEFAKPTERNDRGDRSERKPRDESEEEYERERRERRKEREYEDRHRSSRRERSSSYDRRREKRKDYDDDRSEKRRDRYDDGKRDKDRRRDRDDYDRDSGRRDRDHRREDDKESRRHRR